MQIAFELVGGGSGRSASSADYLVKRTPTDNEVGQPQEALAKQAKRQQLSRDVMACIEIKGSWQVCGNSTW